MAALSARLPRGCRTHTPDQIEELSDDQWGSRFCLLSGPCHDEAAAVAPTAPPCTRGRRREYERQSRPLRSRRFPQPLEMTRSRQTTRPGHNWRHPPRVEPPPAVAIPEMRRVPEHPPGTALSRAQQCHLGGQAATVPGGRRRHQRLCGLRLILPARHRTSTWPLHHGPRPRPRPPSARLPSIPAGQPRPGDVWMSSNAHHTELVAQDDGLLIGSNDDRRGHQRVSYQRRHGGSYYHKD